MSSGSGLNCKVIAAETRVFDINDSVNMRYKSASDGVTTNRKRQKNAERIPC